MSRATLLCGPRDVVALKLGQVSYPKTLTAALGWTWQFSEVMTPLREVFSSILSVDFLNNPYWGEGAAVEPVVGTIVDHFYHNTGPAGGGVIRFQWRDPEGLNIWHDGPFITIFPGPITTQSSALSYLRLSAAKEVRLRIRNDDVANTVTYEGVISIHTTGGGS